MTSEIIDGAVRYAQWTICGNCGQCCEIGTFHQCSAGNLLAPFCVICGKRHYQNTNVCCGDKNDFNQVQQSR